MITANGKIIIFYGIQYSLKDIKVYQGRIVLVCLLMIK